MNIEITTELLENILIALKGAADDVCESSAPEDKHLEYNYLTGTLNGLWLLGLKAWKCGDTWNVARLIGDDEVLLISENKIVKND